MKSGLEYKYSVKTLQLANKVARKRLNPHWNFLADKRWGGRGGEMILQYTCSSWKGRWDEMRPEAIRLRLTLRWVLCAVNARDTVKKWSVLRLNCVWQSLLPLGVMQ